MGFCVLGPHLTRRGLDFCETCEDALRTLEMPVDQRLRPLPTPDHRVLSCFVYRDIVRRCILASKKEGFRRVAPALVRRILGCPLLQEKLRHCDVIMPAPSSLWSRWRGRLDLASLLAQGLAQAAGCLVCWPPILLSFRWQKQSLRLRSQRRGVFRTRQKIYDASYFAKHLRKPLKARDLRVLVVDDIVTTGHTLSELAACFAGIEFEFYTLASALTSQRD